MIISFVISVKIKFKSLIIYYRKIKIMYIIKVQMNFMLKAYFRIVVMQMNLIIFV